MRLDRTAVHALKASNERRWQPPNPPAQPSRSSRSSKLSHVEREYIPQNYGRSNLSHAAEPRHTGKESPDLLLAVSGNSNEEEQYIDPLNHWDGKMLSPTNSNAQTILHTLFKGYQVCNSPLIRNKGSTKKVNSSITDNQVILWQFHPSLNVTNIRQLIHIRDMSQSHLTEPNSLNNCVAEAFTVLSQTAQKTGSERNSILVHHFSSKKNTQTNQSPDYIYKSPQRSPFAIHRFSSTIDLLAELTREWKKSSLFIETNNYRLRSIALALTSRTPKRVKAAAFHGPDAANHAGHPVQKLPPDQVSS